MKYHYSARKASWPYSDEAFRKLSRWAHTQTRFWRNHVSGPLETFTFWATPEAVEEVFDELELDTELSASSGYSSLPTLPSALVIHTDRRAFPDMEV